MKFAALQTKQSTNGQRPERLRRHPFVEELEPRNLLAVYYNPIQMATAYGFPTSSTAGAGQTIAIVDAYNDKTIKSDVMAFNQGVNTPWGTWPGGAAVPQFKTGQFVVVGQTGSTTKLAPNSTSWAFETALDVEWAHAMAPGANIVLVEANSASWADMMAAVKTAASYQDSNGNVSVVSMSWGGNEFAATPAIPPSRHSPGSPAMPGETDYDTSVFSMAPKGVTFVASSGDSGVVSYPAVSPYVLGVGGTILNAAYDTGTYQSETAWSGSGGGVSKYEAIPGYQGGLTGNGVSTTYRNSPDVAFDSGGTNNYVWVFSGGTWYGGYGTSAGAPQWAALVAITDQSLYASGGQHSLDGYTQVLPALYGSPAPGLPLADFHDITIGSNAGHSAGIGYDLVTGLGSPNNYPTTTTGTPPVTTQGIITDLATDGAAHSLANGVLSQGPGGHGGGGDDALATVRTATGATATSVNGFFVVGQAGTFSPANLVQPAAQQMLPPSFVSQNLLAPSPSPTPIRQLGEIVQQDDDAAAAPLITPARQQNNVQTPIGTTRRSADQSQWLPALDAVFGQELGISEDFMAAPAGAVDSQVEESSLVSAMALVGAVMAVGMNRGLPTDGSSGDRRRPLPLR